LPRADISSDISGILCSSRAHKTRCFFLPTQFACPGNHVLIKCGESGAKALESFKRLPTYAAGAFGRSFHATILPKFIDEKQVTIH
jgi:hypothetical protein